MEALAGRQRNGWVRCVLAWGAVIPRLDLIHTVSCCIFPPCLSVPDVRIENIATLSSRILVACARTQLLLASDDSRMITKQMLLINGGLI